MQAEQKKEVKISSFQQWYYQIIVQDGMKRIFTVRMSVCPWIMGGYYLKAERLSLLINVDTAWWERMVWVEQLYSRQLHPWKLRAFILCAMSERIVRLLHDDLCCEQSHYSNVHFMQSPSPLPEPKSELCVKFHFKSHAEATTTMNVWLTQLL